MNDEELTTARRALAVSTRAAGLGFDWATAEDVLDKIEEELAEIREALALQMSQAHIAEEVGDLYFALVNFNRKMQIDSDAAFAGGVTKFERRFGALEAALRKSGQSLADLTPEELENVWQAVKEQEKNVR